MAINKVEYGDRTLIDLTQDTVAPETLLEGETAHDKTGEPIRGTHVPFSGQYDDLQGKPETFPPSSHNQPASTIQAGTFGGQVEAPSNGQNPGVYCMRNSKLSNNGEKPTVNGEVTIGYDGEPSSVMVNGTIYPIGGGSGGGSAIDTLFRQTTGLTSIESILNKPINEYDIIFILAGIYNYCTSTFLIPSAVISSVDPGMGVQFQIMLGEGRHNVYVNLYNTGFQRITAYADVADGLLDIIGIKL